MKSSEGRLWCRQNQQSKTRRNANRWWFFFGHLLWKPFDMIVKIVLCSASPTRQLCRSPSFWDLDFRISGFSWRGCGHCNTKIYIYVHLCSAGKSVHVSVKQKNTRDESWRLLECFSFTKWKNREVKSTESKTDENEQFPNEQLTVLTSEININNNINNNIKQCVHSVFRIIL